MNLQGKAQTYLLLMLTSAVWGFQPICIKWIVAEWTPVTLTTIRYICISAVLFGLLYRKNQGHLLPPKECWTSLLLMGLNGVALNNVLQFTGLQYTTVTNCTLISATGPAITALLAAIFVRERLSLKAWLGIAISFVGVLAVVSEGSLELIRQIAFNFGDVLCFLSQIVWTIYSLLGLKVMDRMSALAVTAWAGLFGGIMTGLFGLGMGELEFTMPGMLAWGSFIYTVFLGGVLSMLCWNLGVKRAGASITAIFLNIMPVVGMIGGFFLLDESIGTSQLAGALAIFGGVYLTTHSG